MINTTLVVMAAGIGSRFGKGIKQLTPVGPNGEIIIDYSIHDALEAGFNKVVFIIRKDIEEEFRQVIGNRMEQLCQVEYVFQELTNLPEGFSLPEGRTKPWGTGQAVLACKGVVNEPFVVINADDYYGKQAFVKIHEYLLEHHKDTYHYCMAGFILKNTLSDNGGVTRGICRIDDNEQLVKVDETHNIQKDGKGGAYVDTEDQKIDVNSYVSMNMWGLTPEFIDILDAGFAEFLEEHQGDGKGEYLLPTIIDDLLQKKRASVQLLETRDKWFGVTYAEDQESVQQAFAQLVKDQVYTSPLN